MTSSLTTTPAEQAIIDEILAAKDRTEIATASLRRHDQCFANSEDIRERGHGIMCRGWEGFVSLGMCSPEAEHAPLIEADIIAGRKSQRDLDDYYAGHLAREIATHGEP